MIFLAAATSFDRVGRAGHDRHAGLLHQLARLRLRAHRVDRVGGRADEDDAGLLAGARERGVLGEEAVAGVDRLGAGLLRDLEDLLDHQVALVAAARAEQVRLVGAPRVRRVAVGLGVDGDRSDPHLLERPHHADRYLAAVGDEDLGEHGPREITAADAPRASSDQQAPPMALHRLTRPNP